MGSFHDLLAELKKRHVYRVAVAYGIVAWFVIQAASIVVPELDLPAWITRAVIVVAMLGFPLAIVLAWAYDITPDGVQRTRGGAPRSTPPAPLRTRPRWRALGLALGTFIVAGVIGVMTLRGADRSVPRGAELEAELRELVADARYVEAFDLAQRARDAGEVLADTLSALFTDRISVVTDPPGARVTALRFAPRSGADSARIDLGRTPLRSVPVARGDYLLRIEAVGYTPVERLATGATWRMAFRDRSEPEVRFDLRLLPTDAVPDGMVHVPGGRYQVASRDHQKLGATLAEYFIDRFEVTHAHFAGFVDAGGYVRAELWSDLAEAVPDAAAVRARFVDRTGLPAPRGWSSQQPPPELREHPVTDVSWYEAAAYCRFRGARLPTLFEWEKAARDGEHSFAQGIVLPWGPVGPREPATHRANFASSGTIPVGSFPFGLSRYGAYDMAGNAKEWLLNRSGTDRAVTGGSYADPIYVFSEVGAMDPAASLPVVGFRCARPRDPSSAPEQGAGPLRLEVTTPVYEPVSDAMFPALLAHYSYDRRPLDPAVEERLETPGWTRERITYNGPAGERVIAYLFIPKTGRPPYQTVVYVPSSWAFFGHNVGTLAEESFGPLVRGGRALFTVVMKGMTERTYPPDHMPPATNSVAFRDEMVLRATELRLGLDYLETRDEIDAARIAYGATSFGAGSRLVFAGVDDRFRAVILVGAGIDERVHPTLPEASNINFAPQIRAPKLVVNGREDEEHPWLTRGLPLWNLLREPKELALFEDVGHVPPAELRIPVMRDFLDRTFGPVER